MPLTPETWLNQFTVNLTVADDQSDPEILQLANGNILVSWTSSNNSGVGSNGGLDVIGQIFDPLGNRIGGEIRLNNNFFADDEQDMEFAALPGGGFVSVFEDTDASGTSIRLNEYDANGVQVSDNSTVVTDSALTDPNYRNPVVAVSSATSVLIVYEEVNGLNSDLVGKIYNSTTNTYGAQFDVLTDNSMENASITVLTNGNYVVTGNLNTADDAIEYRILNSAGANVLSATFVTGTNTNTQNDREATVTALTGGGFVITWTNTDLNDTDILGRVYNAAGTQIGSIFPGDTGGTNNNNESKVIALADGTFVVVWDNDDVLGIEAQHYSATGAALGSIFTVSANNADNISGIGLGDGRFALVWDVSGSEISMEILDTRDNPNDPGVYTPDQWVVGTAGDDVFTPAANAEITHGWEGNDTITESAGTRQYFGDGGNDTIIVTSAINSDRHDGGANNDTINWSASGVSGATFNLTAGTATLGGASEVMVNFENLIGTNNNDTIIGNGQANTLTGLNGNDIFNGGLGVDTMIGGNGDDTYAIDSLADIVTEFGGLVGGRDTIIAGFTIPALVANVERLSLTGVANINGTGNGLNNVISGNTGNNIINGLAGTDLMIGNNGNDTYFVDNTLDFIQEAAGAGTGSDRVISTVSFRLQANVERLDLGGAANINGIGNATVNTIVGNAGNNGINGAGGSDFLLGGAGVDFFGFNTALGAGNIDVIGDFSVIDDTIILENAIFAGLANGALNPAQLHIGSVATAGAGDLIVYNNVNGQTFFDTNGAAAGGFVQFATLSAGLAITAADFFVI